MAEVRKKQDEVQSIKDDLERMAADLQETRNHIERLRGDKDLCERRL